MLQWQLSCAPALPTLRESVQPDSERERLWEVLRPARPPPSELPVHASRNLPAQLRSISGPRCGSMAGGGYTMAFNSACAVRLGKRSHTPRKWPWPSLASPGPDERCVALQKWFGMQPAHSIDPLPHATTLSPWRNTTKPSCHASLARAGQNPALPNRAVMQICLSPTGLRS